MCVELLPSYQLDNEWGVPTNIQSCEIEFGMQIKEIDIVWLSLCEEKFYSVEEKIDFIVPNQDFQTFLVGMMPFGYVTLWIYEEEKSRIIEFFKGEEVLVNMEDFNPGNSDVSLSEYCTSRINNNVEIKNQSLLKEHHSNIYFLSLMKQFVYRYLLQFMQWKNNEWIDYFQGFIFKFDYMEEALFDGTHDKLHDGGLLKYHQAGNPKKLAIKWHIGKSEYSAYFWFEEEPIREVFDKFYGAHPDTKTDFIIRIDAENRKYELALYRYGLKEPQVIPEDVYQLLVFKNKFEDYRSDNYNQERGAWIW